MKSEESRAHVCSFNLHSRLVWCDVARVYSSLPLFVRLIINRNTI